jgi:hypothetical protein
MQKGKTWKNICVQQIYTIENRNNFSFKQILKANIKIFGFYPTTASLWMPW